MAKRKYVDIKQKAKSRSHKTKKRLAVKATMLAAKAAKKGTRGARAKAKKRA